MLSVPKPSSPPPVESFVCLSASKAFSSEGRLFPFDSLMLLVGVGEDCSSGGRMLEALSASALEKVESKRQLANARREQRKRGFGVMSMLVIQREGRNVLGG